MNLNRAIEYLMTEPAHKTPHRVKMETDFFKESGLRFEDRDPIDGSSEGTKHLVLKMESIEDIWCSGMLWLGIIYDHIADYKEMEYTIQYTVDGSEMSYTGSVSPSLALHQIRSEHVVWDVLESYEVIYDGFVTECGQYLPPNTIVSVNVVDNGTLAYTNYGAIDIDALICGEVVKHY